MIFFVFSEKEMFSITSLNAREYASAGTHCQTIFLESVILSLLVNRRVELEGCLQNQALLVQSTSVGMGSI